MKGFCNVIEFFCLGFSLDFYTHIIFDFSVEKKVENFVGVIGSTEMYP